LAHLVTCVVLLALTDNTAWAQKVVVVPPTADTVPLGDAFNRLKAELTLHHFDVVVAREDLAPNPAPILTRLASENRAFAAIALVSGEAGTAVQIWLVDRVSGKTSMRALQVEQTEDATSLLAIRAVDLLRASLREFEPGDRPPADVVGVQRGPVPKVVQALARPTPPTYTLFLEALALYQRPRISFGYGPLLGAAYRLHESVSAGVVFAGPIIGTRFSSALGNTEIRQELAWAELSFGMQWMPRLRAELGLLLGALLLQARGQPRSPWVGRADSTWASLEGIQGSLQWQLSGRVAMQLGVRAMATMPRLGIALGDDQTLLQVPMVAGSVGLRVSL
jgi:hypothetical protein